MRQAVFLFFTLAASITAFLYFTRKRDRRAVLKWLGRLVVPVLIAGLVVAGMIAIVINSNLQVI